MNDYLDLFDVLALCAGLVVIISVGLSSSRRKLAIAQHPSAWIGAVVWLGAFTFALYLVFG
jgi:hypothetical protein